MYGKLEDGKQVESRACVCLHIHTCTVLGVMGGGVGALPFPLHRHTLSSSCCARAVPQVVGTVKGPEGYSATAIFLAEAGIALATQRDSLPAVTHFNGGGFLTPATAFGAVLLNRANNAGVTFAVSE